jgi:hypothetical protein
MRSGAHRTVMPKLIDWCDEASLVNWERDTPPDWSQAEATMWSDGRLSRVRYPSPAQPCGETLPVD